MCLAGAQKLVLMSNLSSTVFSVFFGLSNSYWWAASVRFAQGFFNWRASFLWQCCQPPVAFCVDNREISRVLVTGRL